MSAPGRKCCPRRTKSCIMTAHASCQLVCWILGGHCLLLAAAALTPHTHRLALHSRSNMSASVNERARAPVVQLDDGHYARVMPHLTLPAAKWSTYNLSRSTYTNVCFGPTFQKSSPLNESARWLSKWGLVEIDFESQEGFWAHHHGKDSDVMMVAAAEQIKKLAPDTRVFVYRNLVMAYSNFVQLREKMEDPNYSGWWLKFAKEGVDEKLTPRCQYNSRLNRSLCTDLFHSPLRWTTDGDDCGDVLPCGDYGFDYRNESLREWIVTEFMMGSMGMGHAAVDGFLTDDWYTTHGPSELQHFVQGTGIQHDSPAMLELMGNWSRTTWAANDAVMKAGGMMHANMNCMLDVDDYWGYDFDKDPGDELVPMDLVQCGLHKTNGRPRANNTESAAVWAAPQREVGVFKQTPARYHPYENTSHFGQCADFIRTACDETSVFHKIPTFMAFNHTFGTPMEFPTLYSDVTRFLLVRGKWSWLGYGWIGCVDTAPPLEHFEGLDFGEPLELCQEVQPGVFSRRWSLANVTMDCNTGDASIIVEGHGLIPPVPPPPPRPPPPRPPPPPPHECSQGPCKICADRTKSCSFPVPPLPICPIGFEEQPSGSWANADQPLSKPYLNKTVAGCGELCNATAGCEAFLVYDPHCLTKPEDTCYTFSHGLRQPFARDMRGLVRTCLRRNNSRDFNAAGQ